MEFTIKKETLLNSLENVIKAIDVNNIYVYLRYFYIDVLDEMITIKGSNGYFSIESKINTDIDVKSIGKFLIPSNTFLNIIRKCENEIHLKTNDSILEIENWKDKYQINLLDSNDFPNIDFSLYGNKIKVNSEILKKAIDNVIFACSQTNEDFILTGVNLKYEQGKLTLMATDSFRLSCETIEIKDDRNISFDITVMNKNIKNFIPNDLKEEVELYVNEHKINMINKLNNFQSKIIEAPYKSVSHLFDINFSKQLIIDKNIILNALSKVAIISGESSQNKVVFNISRENIKISTQSEEIGSSTIIIEKSNYEYDNDEISIILNYKYLKEAINVFNDKIRINLTESKGPILIDSENSNSKQLISPIAG